MTYHWTGDKQLPEAVVNQFNDAYALPDLNVLTHWGRVTHMCISNLTIIGSDNGLLPGRHQAAIWTNAWIMLIGPLGTHFSKISIEIQTF